jgi:peptidoglycan/LPS O-acetylase OafA/YrhL
MPDTLPQNPHSRNASLDGLRGIAILLVICWHMWPYSIFFPGWAGVDLFFVLSGYLITGRLLATKGKPHFLSHFYRNRALRILPLYYTFLTGFLLLVRFFVSPGNLPLFEGYLIHWKSFFIFTQNWTFIRYQFPRDLSLGPLWSIAVEVQFYLIWPFVILLTPTPRSRLIVFQVLLAAVFISRIIYFLAFPDSRPSIYYNTFFRMDGFLMGSMLCQLHEMQKKLAAKHVVALLFFLAVIILAVPAATHERGFDKLFFPFFDFALLALFFTLLLHLALQPENYLPFLKNKFLQLSGRISYCLYLVHFPLLSALWPRFDALGSRVWPGHEGFSYGLAVLSTFLLSYAIGLFSYRCFESYFLRLKM